LFYRIAPGKKDSRLLFFYAHQYILEMIADLSVEMRALLHKVPGCFQQHQKKRTDHILPERALNARRKLVRDGITAKKESAQHLLCPQIPVTVYLFIPAHSDGNRPGDHPVQGSGIPSLFMKRNAKPSQDPSYQKRSCCHKALPHLLFKDLVRLSFRTLTCVILSHQACPERTAALFYTQLFIELFRTGIKFYLSRGIDHDHRQIECRRQFLQHPFHLIVSFQYSKNDFTIPFVLFSFRHTQLPIFHLLLCRYILLFTSYHKQKGCPNCLF